MKAFSEEINTGKWTGHPFIATVESYLIWDSEREGRYGASDLYISFRKDYPTFTEPAKYLVPDISSWILVEGIVGLTQFCLFGMLLSLIYKRLK